MDGKNGIISRMREKILKLIYNNKKLTIILSGDRHIGAMYKYNANNI